jgi:streptogramin lyase
MLDSFARRCLSIGAIACLAACAGQAHNGSLPAVPNAMAPDVTKIVLSKKTLSFNGPRIIGNFFATESGYTGSLTAKSSNVHVVQVTPASHRGPKAKFAAAAEGGGTATITIEDDQHHSAKLTVHVTGITLTLQNVPSTMKALAVDTFAEAKGGKAFDTFLEIAPSSHRCTTASGKITCVVFVGAAVGPAFGGNSLIDQVIVQEYDAHTVKGKLLGQSDGYVQMAYNAKVGYAMPVANYLAQYPVANHPSGALTAGPPGDGRMWFTAFDGTNAYVDAITTSGAVSVWQQPLVSGKANVNTSMTAASDGRLWFTQSAAYPAQSAIGAMSISGAAVQYFTTQASGCSQRNGAESIASGSDGNLYYTEIIQGTTPSCANPEYGIGVMSTSGAVLHDYPLGLDANNKPLYITYAGEGGHQIVAGPDGAVWFIAAKCGLVSNVCSSSVSVTPVVGRISTTGQLSIVPLAYGGCAAWITAAGANIWVVQGCVPPGVPSFYANTISQITTSQQVTTTYGGFVQADDVNVGPDGNIYYTSEQQIERVVLTGSQAGQINAMLSPCSCNGTFTSVAAGPDGNLWVADTAGGGSGSGFRIDKIALP